MLRPRLPHRSHGKWLLASSLVLAIGVPSVTMATGEGQPLDGGRRNPSPNPASAYTQETEIIARTNTYGTRQSNKRVGDGGGAIYGCRSNPGREPCVRSNNLRNGRAFEFSTAGNEGGRIDVGDPSGAPLTTNATGVATGFNADQVDGKSASDFAPAADLLFAVVDRNGTLLRGRGAEASTRVGAPEINTYTVRFNRNVTMCSYTANTAGESVSAGLAVLTLAALPDTVRVDQVNGDPANAQAFHLQVIC